MTINGSLLLSLPIVKRFSVENFPSTAKTNPQNGGFSPNVGLNIIFLLPKPPKGTSLHGTASFDVFCVKIGVGASAVGGMKNPPKRTFSSLEELYFTHMGRKTSAWIWSKVCTREISWT